MPSLHLSDPASADATHEFRADSLEEAVEEATKTLGPDIRIVEANRVRRGGVGGFFATDLGVEVVVERVDATGDEPSAELDGTGRPGVERPADPAPMSLTALDALIDDVQRDERLRNGSLAEAGADHVDEDPTRSFVRHFERELADTPRPSITAAMLEQPMPRSPRRNANGAAIGSNARSSSVSRFGDKLDTVARAAAEPPTDTRTDTRTGTRTGSRDATAPADRRIAALRRAIQHERDALDAGRDGGTTERDHWIDTPAEADSARQLAHLTGGDATTGAGASTPGPASRATMGDDLMQLPTRARTGGTGGEPITGATPTSRPMQPARVAVSPGQNAPIGAETAMGAPAPDAPTNSDAATAAAAAARTILAELADLDPDQIVAFERLEVSVTLSGGGTVTVSADFRAATR